MTHLPLRKLNIGHSCSPPPNPSLGAILASPPIPTSTPLTLPLEPPSGLSPVLHLCCPYPSRGPTITHLLSGLCTTEVRLLNTMGNPVPSAAPSLQWLQGLQDNIHTSHLASTPSRTFPIASLITHYLEPRATQGPCVSQLVPATMPLPMLCSLPGMAFPLSISLPCVPIPNTHTYYISRSFVHNTFQPGPTNQELCSRTCVLGTQH